ncbi:MAG: rRNA maturation RNase YbeY [Pyrinomonadaceae bacterium]|nr:rRNA maturation RNase YbeY [Pyrinomonadaceae bacterium]
MIEVVSRQRRREMDCERWQVFGEKALTAIGKAGHDATIAFVSDRQIKILNKRFRRLSKPTDVLSFPAGDDKFTETSPPRLGDIAISVERAESQAAENGLNFEKEIAQLILHGLLHLCGYDHETDKGEMSRLELRLRGQMGMR